MRRRERPFGGKTTLLRLLASLLEPCAGEILVDRRLALAR
jgi:ABC-type Na+ transport system ATPase subunit NatA